MADLLPAPQTAADIFTMDPVVDLRDADDLNEPEVAAFSSPADRPIAEVAEPPPEMIGMYYLG